MSSHIPGLSQALASLYETAEPGLEAQADFIKYPRGLAPTGRDNRGDAMKDWFVPPIIIPFVLVVTLVAYALFRMLF